MAELIVAAGVMLATHYGISSTGLRERLIARLGERTYLIAYSVIAIATFAWLALAYARAPYVELWPMTPWSPWVPLLVMPLALLLLVGGLDTLRPSALGAPASLEAAEPVRGMLRITRHPAMWAIALWALAHLVPNGDLASVILFGLIGGLALLGTRLIDRKFAHRRGADWARFAAASSSVPFAAILAGRQRLVPREIGWPRVALALGLYGALLLAHPWLFGVSPLAAL